MPELTEAWGRVCRDSVKAANSVASDDRANYLKYLAERSKTPGDPNAYQELVQLTDRGLMDTEDVVLESLTVQGEYLHNLQRTNDAKGEIAIAIGPARLAASGSQGRVETSQSNLRLTATFRTRPRSEFLLATLDSLPPRPVAAAPPAKPNP